MRNLFFLIIEIFFFVGSFEAQSFMCYKNVNTIESFSITANYAQTFNDLNHDGFMDLVIAKNGPNSINIYMGNSNGNYSLPVSYNIAGTVTSLHIVDVTGDSINDIIFSSRDATGGASGVLKGNISNGFDSPIYFPLQGDIIKIFDVNGDANADLLVSNGNNLKLLFGRNDGTFQFIENVFSGVYLNNVIVNDFNNDNIQDIVATENNSSIGKFMIRLGVRNHVTNNFTPVTNYSIGINGISGFFLTPTYQENFITKDLNNDGFLDVATTSSLGISVFLNNGDGTLGQETKYFSSYDNASYMTCDDYNNDGNMDLAVSYKAKTNAMGDLYGSKIRLFAGNGLGSFGILSEQYFGVNCVHMNSIDINNDGNKDIVCINGENSCISLGDGSGQFNTQFYGGIYSPNLIQGVIDLNNDGFKEIIISNVSFSNVPQISIVKALSNSEYQAPKLFSTHGENHYTGVNANDYNQDGYNDILITSTDTLDRLSVYYSNALGGLNAPIVFSKARVPSSYQKRPISADFNQDGFLDVIFSGAIFFGSANGITSQSVTVMSNPLATGDFNHDGKVDIVSYGHQYAIAINFGNGNGTFGTNVLYGTGQTPGSAKIVDLNGDGNMDIITSNWDGSSISVLKGSSAGTFSPAVNYSTGVNSLEAQTADFNHDGFLDVAVANYNASSKNISILLGSGTGSLSTYTTIPLNSQPKAMALTDFDSDGEVDIVVAVINGSFGYMFLKGSGNGSFYLANRSYITSVDDIEVADLTQDNLPEIISSSKGALSVLFSGAPNITISGITNICTGANSQLNVFGASTYTWNTNETTSSVIVNPIVTTTYSVIGRDVLGCTNTATATVTVDSNQAPLMAINGNTLLCSGSTTSLNVSGAMTYTWSNGSNGSSTNYTPITNTLASVIGTGSNGCNNTATISINTLSLPNSSISSNLSIFCGVKTVTLSVAGSASNTVLWDNGSTTTSIVVTPSITTLYSAVATGTNTCTKNLSKTITVLNTPSLTISGPTVVCAATINTLVASGADTYIWVPGGTSPSQSISPTVNTNYNVTGISINGCTVNTTYSVNVNPNPMVTISSNSTCIGSSAILAASGANTYSWNTGATTNSITETPTVTTTYSVTGTNLNNCSGTRTVSVIVDNTCQDVWPGDANSDGTADNLDILELGLHYGQIGAPRASTSNSWQSYHADNWTGTISNGKNLNHSDCNGDGIINNDDTLAIYNNYGLTHAFRPANTTTVNPQLSIVPNQSVLIAGSWGSSSIYLGDAANPINNINGIAFTVNFDHTLLDPNSIWIEYPTSFINASNQNLHFRKLNFNGDKIYTATTHTLNNNVSGNGLIGILHYKILSTLSNDYVLNLGISQANQSDANGVITPLTSNTNTLMVLGLATSLIEASSGTYFTINPNPANDVVVIRGTTEIEKIEVLNLAGQILVSEKANSKTHQLNLENLANGVYFVKVYNSQKQMSIKKLVVQR